MRPFCPGLAAVLVTALLSPAVAVQPASAARVPQPAPVAPVKAAPAGALVARYSFDGRRSAAVLDESGRGHTLQIYSAHGGAVRSITHGAGQALAFPPTCRTVKGKLCAHVALRAVSSADLNPGAADISFGATLELGRTQTSPGQNILQKGYSTTSSQYKLQVDGWGGRPSCVVVDNRRPAILVAVSTVSIADGDWHTVECRKVNGLLSIMVDGRLRGARLLPPGLTISNREPLAVGGKGAYRDNDQFQGALDDVWVRIGQPGR